MLKIQIPTINELTFRKELLADKLTMEFNEPTGTIDFNKNKWEEWFQRWITPEDRFYAYLIDSDINLPIGEVAFRYDEEFSSHIINIIIHSKYRSRGYGKEGMKLLIEVAFDEYNLPKVQDNISIHSKKSHKLFEAFGFTKIKTTMDYILYELMNPNFPG